MPRSRTAHRLLALAVAAALVIAAIALDAVAWPFIAMLAAPDLALLAGAGRGLSRGQLHPRAVRLYNAAHHGLPPLALIAAAAATGHDAWLAAGLGWATHVAIDRAAGYGLRTADGFQRCASAR